MDSDRGGDSGNKFTGTARFVDAGEAILGGASRTANPGGPAVISSTWWLQETRGHRRRGR